MSMLSIRNESGEFVEVPVIIGPRGFAGEPGHTPVKGTDYWTEADQTQIVNDVLAALPTWEGGSY